MAENKEDDIGLVLNENYFSVDNKDDSERNGEDTEKKEEEAKASKEEEAVSLFEQEVKLLKVDKTDILNMILSLSDHGYISEVGAILNGKIPYEIRSTTVKQGMRMSELYEERDIKTQVASTDFFSLHVLAGFLYSYNGEVLPADLEDKAKWITDNLSGVVFKALKNKAITFSRKTDLLTYEEVEDFL